MRSYLCALILAAGFLAVGGCFNASPTSISPYNSDTRPIEPPLPNGRSLGLDPATPSIDVGSMPVNIAASADGQFAVSTGAGSQEALWVIRTRDGNAVSHLDFPKSAKDKSNGLYYGLAFSPDDLLYASQGGADRIAVLKLNNDGSLTQLRQIATGKGDFPAGLALDGRGYLYVANNDSSPVSGPNWARRGNAAIYATKTGTEVGQFVFPGDELGVSNFPLAVAVKNDGSEAYITSERDGVVYALNTLTPNHPTLIATIATGSHPDALLLNKSQSRLFVANAHSDTISIIDTASDHVVGTVLLRPEIARDLPGATPTSLALAPDGRTLYASLGDMNAVAIIDLADGNRPQLEGYVSAGWYPTGVVVSPDGKRLLVTNGKGSETRHPNLPTTGRSTYVLNILHGSVTTVAVPASSALPDATDRVLADNRLTPRALSSENPLKEISLQAGRIRHVVYIVKENRTYDYVLGDLSQGNGDPALCLFGREITPNLHALAERFVLFDNFYATGDVSGEGWVWVTQAMANENVMRNVPYSYSGRGRHYDFEGLNNDYLVGGFPAMSPDGKPLSDNSSFKNGAPSIPDVTESPGGHLWDLARKHGLTLRNWGMFSSVGSKNKDGSVLIPDNYPDVVGLQPGGHDRKGFTDVDFRRFDLDYADSDAASLFSSTDPDPNLFFQHRTYGKYQMPSRYAEWKREFDEMLAADPAGNTVPNLMLVRFPNDHTTGLSPAKHSPRSMVADNDYAVGELVEAISESPIWGSTAIFVVEDDASNGQDHVDCHRSTCYVISPWIKPHQIDHTFQSSVSVIRTMELLLGLPAMNQYDAVATPILDWDSSPHNEAPYQAIAPARKWIADVNPPRNPHHQVSSALSQLMERSAEMDFSRADQAPADELNAIIWKSVKGVDSVPPPPVHGPTPYVNRGKHKDDDDD